MLSSTFAIVICTILFCQNISANEEKQKTIIDVDVYYESLCPDSMRFIKSQLIPAYPVLKDHLNITFIPFGKASYKKEENEERYSFSCQHGPNECHGNRAMACGLFTINQVTSEENREQQSVDLVGCIMSSSNPAYAIQRCAEEMKFDESAVKRMTECSESLMGDQLLESYGKMTEALNPKLSFVPTVVINHMYSKDNQSAALKDFRSLICGLLPADEKPADCEVAQ